MFANSIHIGAGKGVIVALDFGLQLNFFLGGTFVFSCFNPWTSSKLGGYIHKLPSIHVLYHLNKTMFLLTVEFKMIVRRNALQLQGLRWFKHQEKWDLVGSILLKMVCAKWSLLPVSIHLFYIPHILFVRPKNAITGFIPHPMLLKKILSNPCEPPQKLSSWQFLNTMDKKMLVSPYPHLWQKQNLCPAMSNFVDG